MYIPYSKRKHFPLVYLDFVRRTGRHPKYLFADLAGENTSKPFDLLLTIKGVKILPVPRDEHHSLGLAERAIQTIDLEVKAILSDSKVPRKYWDILGDHFTHVSSMTSPSRDDPTKTIFESTYGAIPNLDLLPRVGCFAVRLQPKTRLVDWKLDQKNQPGVFLGFGHLKRSSYGSVLLVENSVVVAKHQVAYDSSLMTFHAKRTHNTRSEFLSTLLGYEGYKQDTEEAHAEKLDPYSAQNSSRRVRKQEEDPASLTMSWWRQL